MKKKLKVSIKNFERLSKTHFSDLQMRNFLSNDINEVRIPRINGKPDEIIFTKVKLDDKFNNDFLGITWPVLFRLLKKKNLNSFTSSFQVILL